MSIFNIFNSSFAWKLKLKEKRWAMCGAALYNTMPLLWIHRLEVTIRKTATEWAPPRKRHTKALGRPIGGGGAGKRDKDRGGYIYILGSVLVNENKHTVLNELPAHTENNTIIGPVRHMSNVFSIKQAEGSGMRRSNEWSPSEWVHWGWWVLWVTSTTWSTNSMWQAARSWW